MKIRFIRHGDPDYGNDTLTEKGRKEAQLLAKTAHSPALVPTSATKVVTEEGSRGLHIFWESAWETVLICMRETRSRPLYADLRAVWK